MEAYLAFAQVVMDAINGFNELKRHPMRAAIMADTRLHCILPFNDMLNTNMEGELWYFDEEGSLSHILPSRRGVRHGCVLGIFILCVTMAPIYRIPRFELGPDGMLVAYSDDVYLHGPPVCDAVAITATPALYKKVGLRIGWGPAKSELALPPCVDLETLVPPRDEEDKILPHIVQGLAACLGIPRNRRICVNLISKTIKKPAARHDRLLHLVRDTPRPTAGVWG